MSDKPLVKDLLVAIAPPDPDGGQEVIRMRGPTDSPVPHEVMKAVLYPVEDGKPLRQGGNLLSLTRLGLGAVVTKDHGLIGAPVQEDQVVYEDHEGPARFTTDAYRTGWDEVFGGLGRKALPN